MPQKNIILITPEDLTETSQETIIIDEQDLPSSQATQDRPPVMSKEQTDTMLLIDTSGSMTANDYPPDRLSAAKFAAKMFTQRKVIQNYKDRVGVIGFGGSPVLIHPLDTNLDQVAASIDNLQITHSGTLIGSAIQIGLRELAKFATKRRCIVLLSDGADRFDNSDPVGVAKSGKDIKVFTIGIGTTKGATAHLPHGDQYVVLNEDVLKQIAKVSGGDYLYAPDIQKLQAIYSRLADY